MKSSYWTNNLFNDSYLKNDLPLHHKDMWDNTEIGPFADFVREFLDFIKEKESDDSTAWNETDTVTNWIRPVMRFLGWEELNNYNKNYAIDNASFTIKESGRNKSYRPDLLYFDDPAYKSKLKNTADPRKASRHPKFGAKVMLEAKYWDRLQEYKLETNSDKKRNQGAKKDDTKSLSPEEQTLKYMEIVDHEFGILSDGKTWRLLHKDISTDSNRYYEFDLGDLAKLARNYDKNNLYGQVEAELKYFYYFFSKEALHITEGKESLVQNIFKAGKKYVPDESEIKKKFIGAMGYICNSLKKSIDANGENVNLDLIRDVAESEIFNFLFIKSCEIKRILPNHVPDYYINHSITRIVDVLYNSYYNNEMDFNHFLPQLKEAFGKKFEADSFEIHDRLRKLYQMVHDGDIGLKIIGFKECIFSPAEQKFSKRHKIPNKVLFDAIFTITFVKTEKEDHEYQQIPYNYITPRQLGDIYESFLEFKLDTAESNIVFHRKQWKEVNRLDSPQVKRLKLRPEHKVKKGELFFTPNREDRKMTGSYFTPDYIVKYIIENTLGPLIDGKASNEILTLTVCDPSMGSGHFLVGALEYISDRYRDKLSEEIMDRVEETPEKTKRMVLKTCIFGVDINPRAVKLAKMSLWLSSAYAGEELEGLDDQLTCGDSVYMNFSENMKKDFEFEDFSKVVKKCAEKFMGSINEGGIYDGATIEAGNKKYLDWLNIFPCLVNKSGFDAIFTNPPYVEFKKLQEDVATLAFIKQKIGIGYKFNLYTAILSNCFKILRDGGGLGFICPNSISKEKYNLKLRKKLVEETEFTTSILISDAGKPFEDVSNDDYYVLTCMKKKPDTSNEFKVAYDKEKTIIEQSKKVQAEIKDEFEYQFNYFHNGKCSIYSGVISKIESNSTSLDQYCKIRVGLTPSKSYKETYGSDYQNYKKKHKRNKNLYKYLKANKGNTYLEQYIYSAEDYHIVWDRIELYKDKVAPGELWMYQNNKIITRNRGKEIYVAFDESGVIVNDLFNICVPKDEKGQIWKKLNLRFLTGLLNSQLFNFYFKNNYTFRDFKATYLKLTPIKEYKKYFIEEITGLVKEIEKSRKTGNEEWIKLQAKLDNEIWKYYDITDNEKNEILLFLENYSVKRKDAA